MPLPGDVAKVASRGATLKFNRIKALSKEIQNIRDAGYKAVLSAPDRDVFRGMFNTLDKTYEKFTELWYALEEYHLENEETEPAFPDSSQGAVFEATKNWFYEAQGFHVKVMAAVNPPPSRQFIPNTSSLLDTGFASQSFQRSARNILPEISIKEFKGDYTEWATFKQTFETLIIEEASLDDTERFHYLVSYTAGPAFDIIKHIPVCKENFAQAWESLVKVFDDKRTIACTHLNRLLEFKPGSGPPTIESLQQYLSHVMEGVSCIKNLSIPNLSDYLLCELALRGLDAKTRDGFESSNLEHDFPTIARLETYVRGRCNVLRRTAGTRKVVDSAKPPLRPHKPPNKYAPSNRHALMAHSASSPSDSDTPSSNNKPCFICTQDHRIADCPQFKSKTPPERLGLLKRFRGCRNCLSPAHKTKFCNSKGRCRKCKGTHHSDLHLEQPQGIPNAPSSQPSSANDSRAGTSAPATPSFSGHSSADRVGVLLGTIVADLKGSNGEVQSFRGIIDPGSQFSFATEVLARRLSKSTRPFSGAISGVNHSPLQHIKGKITLTLVPMRVDPLVTDAIVVPSITPFLPQNTLDDEIWDDYRSYPLSDPNFNKAGPIHFLIGADIYPDIVTGAPIVIHEDGPRLMPTIFGFTVIGRYSHSPSEEPSVALLTFADLPNLMRSFWETEEINYSPLLSPEDEQCEQHFAQTHYRNEEGRYVVRLPFKSTPPDTIVHLRPALNRFYSLESKLAKNETLRKAYCSQMEEYLTLGHMSPAKTAPRYIIPHHAVFKEEAGKPKLRVVFDASFSTGNGSLNDYLFTGPKLQADISTILLNFRRFKYVLKCDIVKMFRQILVDPADRGFQQVIWRSSPEEPIRFYELNTVSFGVCSSPFQAIRVLQEHARQYLDKYPDAASLLLHHTYVDDVTAGSDSLDHLASLKMQLIEILQDAGFELAKWNSNHPSLLNTDETSEGPVSLGAQQEDSTKILGIHWNPCTDVYSYRTSAPPAGSTKRAILSSIARLYDPLGYLGPVVFHAKCTMQRTWASKLAWDDQVPSELKSRWEQFTSELPELSKISIPRALPPTDTTYQLVCFSDASESGVGAAVYLRATQGANVSMTLIKSKSRVAPLKTKTIPRLELDGALLLSEVLESLDSFRKDLSIERIFCFTDSMIVLAWLKTPPYRLQTYVSNRVQKILELVPISSWYHVKGVDNPADVLSRGISPAELKDHPLWWSGPPWCTQPIEDWPISAEMPPLEIPELKKTQLALVMVTATEEFVEYAKRHSSFTRFVRVMAYVKRFIGNCRIPKAHKQDRVTGPVSSTEFKQANLHYLQLVQHFCFPEVFTSTSANALPHELRKLNVFVDPDGLIRVGGRLKNAPIPTEQKNQILLPARSYYTNLVVNFLHRQNHHAGPAALLSTIHQQYWIPRAKNLIRHIRHKCVVCTRFSKARSVPFMGDLPKSRFAGVRPFLITGVDMAGPFLYRESANRKAATAKAYLCLFTCMSSRALHLEVTTSLSVEAFLDAFDRFTARRGLPAQMLSDGGSNFRGAARYIDETTKWFEDQQNQGDIVSHTAHLGTKWSFNPPYAPHFGGSWEVSVRLVKDLLHKAFGNQPFLLPELATIFTKIEGALNSRPLQPVSTSPEDLEPLTPGHFLIGQPLNSLPEPDFLNIPNNRLNRWQLIRERVQYFWDRWKREYLNGLQVRQKWDKRSPNIVVGDMVLLMETNTPPAHWPLGRICEVHPGDDHVVRVATVRTAKGIYKRPAVKLVRLDLSDLHS